MYLMNSFAEALIEFKSAKSNFRKIASLPVSSFNSLMADFAFSSLRTAMYTFALCKSNACTFYNVNSRGPSSAFDKLALAVSFPTPI